MLRRRGYLFESDTSDELEKFVNGKLIGSPDSNGFVVVKNQGPGSSGRPYSVWKIYGEGHWPRAVRALACGTKREAEFLRGALSGNRESARKWYRELVAKYVKDKYIYPTKEDAWKAAVGIVAEFGFGPNDVGADKDTGEPKD